MEKANGKNEWKERMEGPRADADDGVILRSAATKDPSAPRRSLPQL